MRPGAKQTGKKSKMMAFRPFFSFPTLLPHTIRASPQPPLPIPALRAYSHQRPSIGLCLALAFLSRSNTKNVTKHPKPLLAPPFLFLRATSSIVENFVLYARSNCTPRNDITTTLEFANQREPFRQVTVLGHFSPLYLFFLFCFCSQPNASSRFC